MSKQGSVGVAQLIDLQQRIRRLDDRLDKMAAERRALVRERNLLDPMEWRGDRSLSSIPDPIQRPLIQREEEPQCESPHCWSEYGTECGGCR